MMMLWSIRRKIKVYNHSSGDNIRDLFDYVIHWRRPEDIFLTEDNEIKEIKVFNYNEPEPNDIQQVYKYLIDFL